MLNREPGNRTLPTFITLLVIGLLLMTFDVRSEGAGVTGTLRTGAQTLVAPLQKAAAFLVNPVVDTIDSLGNVATLREENLALRRALEQAEAELIAVDDQLARLELYQQLYDLEASGADIGRTVAEVIGQPDAFDQALIIDKGESDGIAVGQPVIDTNGYVVGSVQQATAGTAIIVPITVGPDQVTVMVGKQNGTVAASPANDEMTLEILEAREPVLVGARVVTSSGSVRFPSGYPVGEVTADAAPGVDGALRTSITPFVNIDSLRVVVVLAWPPDPITAITPDTTTTTTSTTTTVPGNGSSTTSTTEGGG